VAVVVAVSLVVVGEEDQRAAAARPLVEVGMMGAGR
jgi:hypothetical protein